VCFSRRLRHYFSKGYLEGQLKLGKSKINSSLLKYGLENFSLEILEYCEPEQCLEREDDYIKLYQPEYNILQKAGSCLGCKRSEETRKKISNAQKGENNSMFNRTGEKNPMFGQARQEGSGKPSQAIEVTNVQTNTKTSYNSFSEAAKALNIQQSTISMFLKNNKKKPYKNSYIFTKI
jgi:group I intron endonuclease